MQRVQYVYCVYDCVLAAIDHIEVSKVDGLVPVARRLCYGYLSIVKYLITSCKCIALKVMTVRIAHLYTQLLCMATKILSNY